jgi:GT2 family glycosyltransferase
MQQSIAILIVNYNSKQDTIECIRSLQAAGALLKHIYIIDNHSTDGSVEEISQQFGTEINLVHSDANNGYAYALNLGIRSVCTENYPWFLLMNNDTIVDRAYLQELSTISELHPEISIWNPVINYFDKPNTIWHLGAQVIPGTLITSEPFHNKENSSLDRETIPIIFAHGCAMMVHADVFKKIGLLDDSFFMYAEEVDFCWRAHLAGFQASAAPKAKIIHKGSVSSNRQKKNTHYLRSRNQIFFYRRYSNLWQLGWMFGFTFFRSLFKAGSALIHLEPGSSQAILHGWLDGWIQTLPERSHNLWNA